MVTKRLPAVRCRRAARSPLSPPGSAADAAAADAADAAAAGLAGSVGEPVAAAGHRDVKGGVDEPVQDVFGDDGVGLQLVPVGRGPVAGDDQAAAGAFGDEFVVTTDHGVEVGGDLGDLDGRVGDGEAPDDGADGQ